MTEVAWKARLNHVFDAAVVLSALSLSLVVSRSLKPHGGLTLVVLCAVSLALAVRRRAPLAVAWLTAGAAVLLPVAELLSPGSMLRSDINVNAILLMPPAAPFAVYAVTAFSSRRRLLWLPVMSLAGVATAIVAVIPHHDLLPAPERSSQFALGFRSVAFIAGGALLGLVIAARRRLLDSYTERVERAERDNHLAAERARAEERTRLAAEMHDVVAHRVSRMVLQAGALQVTAPDDATRLAAEELRAAGCKALEELRDVVGLLRQPSEGGPAAEPVPAGPLPNLEPLIAESEAVGISVETLEEGDRVLASPVVGRTAYRIVQEALTNVRKHAPGARAHVHVRYRGDGVHITVRNTPATRPVDSMLIEAGSGTGLSGLRQRVELVDGTFAVGPEPDGGFQVRATLPTYVPTSPRQKDSR